MGRAEQDAMKYAVDSEGGYKDGSPIALELVEPYLAGARALLEWARFRPMLEDRDEEGYVKFSDLEAYFAEQSK